MRVGAILTLAAAAVTLMCLNGSKGLAATLRVRPPSHARHRQIPALPYGWPVRPFDEAHPIRGGFDDPRIGVNGRDFHFGIDISTADGTPIYSVSAGTVYFERTNAVGIRVTAGRAFDYWHVVPLVPDDSVVREHELIAFGAPGWGHVHFTEIEHGYVVNPLRPGALEPLRDHVRPTIGDVTATSNGEPLDLQHLWGYVDLVADVSDTADARPPAPWSDAVFMPALVKWRITRIGAPPMPWVVAVDFRARRLPAAVFDDVYANGTRENTPGERGRYLVYLAHGFDTMGYPGPHQLEIAASDTSGNTTIKKVPLMITAPRR